MKRLNLLLATVAVASSASASEPCLPGLAAAGPALPYSSPLKDFGRLIGHWRMTIETYKPDGSVLQKILGDWEFGWILEGRAVQDVFVTYPTKPDAKSGLAPSIGEYGTTVRMYDPTSDAWQITYFGPRHNLSAAFTARRVKDDMVLTRTEAGGDLTHWVFDRIEPRSFRWRALTSSNAGATWRLDQMMIGSRPYGAAGATRRRHLRMSRRSRVMLSRTPVPLVTVDTDSVFRAANRAARTM